MGPARPSGVLTRLLLALLLTVPAVLIAGSSPAQACSCAGGPPRAGVRAADVIFEGTVAKDDGGNGIPRTLTFDVSRVWKGDAGGTTEIRTGSGGGDCGLGTSTGDTSMVFAYRDEDSNLAASICSSLGASRATVERMLGPGAPSAGGTVDAPDPFGGAILVFLLRLFGLGQDAT